MKRRTLLSFALFALLMGGTILPAQTGTWTQETAAAGWPARRLFDVVHFNNELWVLGGNTSAAAPAVPSNDIWRSSDGVTWTSVTTTGPMWTARQQHVAVVYNSLMWVMGGNDGANKNDVWSSPDGINWTQVTAAANWSGRTAAQVLVHNNAMFLMGGSVSGNVADVWTSTNGSTWTLVTAAANWTARRAFRAEVFNNQMWVMGGILLGNILGNDVWYSTDGQTWTQATASALWTARHGFTLSVLDGRLWVMGGTDGTYKNDVYSSADGVAWTQETAAAPWGVRVQHASVVMNNRLFILGGHDNTGSPAVTLNDVWSFSLGQPQITSTPPIVATAGVAYSYTVVATGNPTPTITATGLPAWLMFDNIDTLSGTPGAADIGLTPQITVTAGNAIAFDQQQFQIDVQGVAPLITSTPPTSAAATSLYTYNVTATGEPAPTLSTGTLPAWLNFNPTTGELSGTPGAADVGTAPVIDITAANGWAPDDVQSFTINVTGLAPTITSTPLTTATVGSLYSYTVTADGIPAPTLSAGTLPGWLSFNPGTGELSGTPSGSDIGVSPQIDITATNTVAPDDVQSFTITVNGLAPTFTTTPVLTATPGTFYTYTAAATGTPTPSIAVTSTLPAWLNFNATTGELSGTPTNSDAKTTVSVTLTATNGVAPDGVQSFDIEVARSPDAKQSDSDGNGCTGTQGRSILIVALLAALGAAWICRRKLAFDES